MVVSAPVACSAGRLHAGGMRGADFGGSTSSSLMKTRAEVRVSIFVFTEPGTRTTALFALCLTKLEHRAR